MIGKIVILFFITFLFIEGSAIKNKRWYTEKQVQKGEVLFLKYCASCHGKRAQKTVQWKKILSDGSYPSPPLNGNAHAWHHPKSKLKDIISNGGKLYDGKMPAFKEILSSRQEDELIAYFQHFWSDDIYSIWKTNGGLSR